jgi:hypothetical protein
MKKLLLLATLGLLVSSGAFAVEFPNSNGPNSCTACGDESEISTEITVCAGVRVPLCIEVLDATITFPCLRRPLTSYATHHTDGWRSSASIDPCDPGHQAKGNTAKIRIQGDADDEVFIDIVQGLGVAGHQLYLQHQNTASEFSTGPHKTVVGGVVTTTGSGSNPDYLIVDLQGCVSQQSLGSSGTGVLDANILDCDNTPTNSYPNNGYVGGAGGSRLKGPNTPISDSFTLSHNDQSGFAGTGGLFVWFGGNVTTQAGQQRGQYSASFKVKVSYTN